MPTRSLARPPTRRATPSASLTTKLGAKVPTVPLAATAVVTGGLLIGRAGCGFDSSWSLVWAGNALHGQAGAHPAGVIIPTPHPASLIWAMLIRLGPADMSRTAWAVSTEFVLAVLLAGVFVLGARIGGRRAGFMSALAVAALPALGTAVSSGTIDVLFAAAVVWSVILAVPRPGLALAVAALAALARPEAAAMLLFLAIYRWRAAGVRFRVGAVLAAVAAPCGWLLMGAALFADPLVALHVTVANAGTGHDRLGAASVARALHTAGGSIGLILAGCALAYAILRRKESPDAAFGGSCCAAMGIVLVIISASGAAIPARYFAAELACAVPIAIGSICAVPKGPPPRWVALAAAGCLAIIAVATSFGPRSARTSQDATQSRELAALGSVLDADQRCRAISLAPHVFLPVVMLDASRPVLTSTSSSDNLIGACRLAARDPLTVAGDGWGPEPATLRLEPVPPTAHLITANTYWVLYAS